MGTKNKNMNKLEMTLSGIQLANPVIPASGTYGFGDEFAELYDINCLGGISFKGTTRQARYGNPLPRIAECGNYGMINAVGLQNPGVEHVIAHELPRLKSHYNGAIIANVSGFSIEEYVETCALLDKEPIDILEVNISCPNVHNGGMAFGTSPEAAAEVTAAVKAVTTKPVYMKLSPNVTDIVAIVSCKTLVYTKLLLNLYLSCDTGMVGSGNPKGVKALHSLVTNENVLKGLVKGVAHVELSCDVGRGDHYGE